MATPSKSQAPAPKPVAPAPAAPPRARFIQTLTPFPQGTRLPCEGGRLYHFLPNEFGDYVAEVLRDDDYEKILSISAGYQPYWPEKSTKAQELREKAIADKETAKATDEKIASESTETRASLAAEADQERERIARNRDLLAKSKDDQANKASDKG